MTAIANSTRIAQRFAALREAGELGIVAYITAGDPSLDATLKFVIALAEAGADVIELGIPFSDPVADGPVIQRASERALKAGTTLASVIELVRRIRQSNSAAATKIPIVLFGYYNPMFQMGIEKFAACSIRRRSRRSPRHRSHARRIHRVSKNSRRAQSRHCFSRRSNLHRRAHRQNFCCNLWLPLSHLTHRRNRRKRFAARRSSVADSSRAVAHESSARRRLRNLVARTCFRSRRTRRCRSDRLRARFGNRKSGIRRCRGASARREDSQSQGSRQERPVSP